MQRVKRTNNNIHPILDEIDAMYAYLSEPPSVALIPSRYDFAFEELVKTFEDFTDVVWSIDYFEKKYKRIKPIENNNLILAFSGGKDSIASALKFKESGYNVYLYHLKHINPSFADEWKCAKESADILGMPIFFDDIQFSGHHMYMEHPMKNMLIANGALSYGIREGVGTTIAFGNYTTSYLDDNVFDRCAGDCVDMWWLYEKIIQRVIPNFEIQMNIENMGETIKILEDKTDLLNASLSCLCRHSLRDYRRQWVSDKFGIELFNKRCGSCYKCCVEYIYMADHDRMKFSEDYYKYCLGQLLKVMRAENVVATDIRDIWDTYIIYDIGISKIKEQLLNAEIRGSKIIWK